MISTIGIIGGADGPTAVFVTGSPISLLEVGILVCAVVIGAAVGVWLYKRNRNNN